MSERLNNHLDISTKNEDSSTSSPIARREFLNKLIRGGIGIALGYEALNSLSNHANRKSMEKQINDETDQREYWAAIGGRRDETLLPKEQEIFLQVKKAAEKV